MLKRMIVMVTATLTVVAGLGFVKFKQIQTAIAQGAAYVPPPEAVTTIVAAEEQWPSTLTAIGTIAAVRGVTVSADLPGVVDRIAFESSQGVRGGDVLAVLDTRQERAQLAAAEAQRDLARINFERMQGLLNERVVSQAEFDRAQADERQTDARVGEIRAAIERKTIKAPFAGVLGIRKVNLGQYLSGGDALVTLQSLNPIYVNFGVPQQALAQLKAGRKVRVTVEDLGGPEFAGPITAIDSVVDESTRNVQAQATLANPAGTLRPGMFVDRRGGTDADGGRVAACVRDSTRAVRRFGVRRRRPEGSEGPHVPRRPAAVREAGRLAGRSDCDYVRPQARRRGRDVRRVQAAQRRRGPRQ